MSYESEADVPRSAYRHNIDSEDAVHVTRNAVVVVEEVGQDPTRYLVLGPDRVGNLLEVVVMDRPQGPAVIHSMPMQAKYRVLLEERKYRALLKEGT
ncbi:MAG: hypothetical protein M0013_08885 [Actinomycetota bacterium]|nr:hypothetical protein [Actinomycetota bacterium]